MTALASALVLAASAVADQRSAKRVKTRKTLSPAMLVDLARESLWLIAIVLNLAGFALQVVRDRRGGRPLAGRPTRRIAIAGGLVVELIGCYRLRRLPSEKFCVVYW